MVVGRITSCRGKSLCWSNKRDDRAPWGSTQGARIVSFSLHQQWQLKFKSNYHFLASHLWQLIILAQALSTKWQGQPSECLAVLHNHGDCEEELWFPLFFSFFRCFKKSKTWMGWVEGTGSWSVVILLQIYLQYCTVCFKNMLHSKRGKGFHSLLSAAFDL